jgi:phage/plasmid-like protein (TIGR03299 family)
MPDSLEREASERTGVTAIDRSPWGREGVVLNSSRYEQALELAGLDYEVVKVPAYRERLHSTGDGFVESKTAFATVRADRDVELGIVGPQYEPLQNRDAFQVIEPWVDRGVLHIELGGVMRDGADAWLLGRFDLDLFGPVVQEVFADQVVPYILVANNHDGRRSARIAETPIRIACANMLDMVDREVKQGRGSMVAVRHTPKAAERMLEAAEELLGAIVDRYEMLGKEYQLLKETKLDWGPVVDPLHAGAPGDLHGEEILPEDGRDPSRVEVEAAVLCLDALGHPAAAGRERRPNGTLSCHGALRRVA